MARIAILIAVVVAWCVLAALGYAIVAYAAAPPIVILWCMGVAMMAWNTATIARQEARRTPPT